MSTARAQLVAIGRELVDAGLSPGQSGNMSVRDENVIIMTPTNSSLGSLQAQHLSVISLDGLHLDGPPPSKEVPLHVAMYKRDTQAGAVVHVHSPHATALSCRDPWRDHNAIPPITPYVLIKVGQVPLIPYFAPGDPSQAVALSARNLAFRGALLANHGSIASGVSLADAQTAVAEIEAASRIALLLANSEARLLTDDQILELTTKYGTPWTPADATYSAASTSVKTSS